MRPSVGRCTLQDDGARVTVTMEVAGLGTLTLVAEAKYSELFKHFHWDQTAVLRARIK